MTSPPIFPALAGQGWSVHKKPTFATTIASHVSAREVRSAHYANPVWQFELSFDGLDATAAAQYGGLGAQSLQSLMGLFLQCQGQYGAFLFYDATSFLVVPTCGDREADRTGGKVFAWYQLIVIFVLPLLVMLYAYSLVIVELWFSSKDLARLNQADRWGVF